MSAESASILSRQNKAFSQQLGPPGYYRWRVATEYLRLPRQLDGAVLDVGAQNGAFLEGVQAGLKIGIDLVEQPLSSLLWSRTDARLLPFRDDAFQHVLAFDIIEHIEEDTAVLHEISRVLAPGGALWLSTTQHNFYLFPGGIIQRRLERAWGHVRRGYSRNQLQHKMPSTLSGVLLPWPEVVFRHTYLGLKILHACHPVLARRMMDWIYNLDRWRAERYVETTEGHWFGRFQKKR